ncbi:hypothetical protein F5888DRAFT_1632256 [Russula emetica]|nr:hypothetical protein F5888DRAFT_1632256 [Russula emetica]
MTVEDEKKPFDKLGAQNDNNSQSDSNEHLMVESVSTEWIDRAPVEAPGLGAVCPRRTYRAQEWASSLSHRATHVILSALFCEHKHWPIKLLREKTQQPDVYLKEVLSEITTLHRSGEFNGALGAHAKL